MTQLGAPARQDDQKGPAKMSAKNRGKKKKKKVEGDRYYTPKWLVRQCVDHILPILCLRPPETILEPCAGTGRFVEQLRARYLDAKIACNDLMPPPGADPWPDADHSRFGDYLEMNLPPTTVDLTISNPPFGPALAIIEHALSHSKRVIMLLRQGFLSTEVRAEFFRLHRPAYVFIVANRPAFDVPPEVLIEPEYEWVEGQTDSADYCFVCWDLTTPTETTYLEWLPPVPLDERKAG